MKVLLIIFIIRVFQVYTFPINNEDEAELYLQKFGYLVDSYSTGVISGSNAISTAIKDFQRFTGINQTGELDNDTIKMMNTPRCGEKDKIGHSDSARKKRYVLEGSKWKEMHLTYRITKYPTMLKDRAKIDEVIAGALKLWSDVSPLTFEQRKRGRVKIDIRFEIGDHGDHEPFDGPGETLAHASQPKYGIGVHFDDEEDWSFDEISGTNLFQVAAHEFGHVFGIGHSEVREAIMYPYETGERPTMKLHSDDIAAIQALYGPKNQPIQPDTHRHLRPPNLCHNATIDAVTRTEDGNTYVFKGRYYWKILSVGIADGYPRKISDDWDGLEGNFDAALTWSDGKTFFFQGDHYWRFSNKARDSGFPKVIRRGFEDIPDMLDAACVWSGNGRIYFFKGDQYWRFDSKNNLPQTDKYPMSINSWNGLPTDGVDAAFQWENNQTYFFKGDKYYKYNDQTNQVDPSYPRSTAEWWFGCKADP